MIIRIYKSDSTILYAHIFPPFWVWYGQTLHPKKVKLRKRQSKLLPTTTALTSQLHTHQLQFNSIDTYPFLPAPPCQSSNGGWRPSSRELQLNRIQGTVVYMRPLKYWLRCRPTILRNIVIQIEWGIVLEALFSRLNTISLVFNEAWRRKVYDPFEVQQTKMTLYKKVN